MSITANFYVYEHIRNDTGAVFYVGKGSAKRAKHNANRSVYWNRVVNKAGGFTINYPVKNVDEELSLLAEMELIDKYRKLGVQLVNVSAGGEGTTGWIPTDETKRKIGLANKTTPKAIGEAHGMYGKKHTEESLAKMRASQKARDWENFHPMRGKQHSNEIRLKIAKAIAGKNVGEKNGFYGKTHTEEARQKISQAGIGRKLTEETIAKKSATALANAPTSKLSKPVMCLTNGITYYGLNDASKQLKLHRQAIRMVCNSKLKQTGGYKFQWINK
jgi:hypothetical protein